MSCVHAFAGVTLPEGWSVKTKYRKSGAVGSRVGDVFQTHAAANVCLDAVLPKPVLPDAASQVAQANLCRHYQTG